jgi:hypothetical protein
VPGWNRAFCFRSVFSGRESRDEGRFSMRTNIERIGAILRLSFTSSLTI